MKCMSCGKEMKHIMGGNYTCDCGASINDCVYRPNNSTAWPSDWGEHTFNFGNQGWVCPKCGAVLSPSTSFCQFCAPGYNKITYGTSTGDCDLNLFSKTISEELKDG